MNVAYCRRDIAWFTRYRTQLIRGVFLQEDTSLIVGEPHADPQPFMGPVIDNDTADMLTDMMETDWLMTWAQTNR